MLTRLRALLHGVLVKKIQKSSKQEQPESHPEESVDGLAGVYLEISVDQIDPDPANPNKMSEAAFDGLVNDIKADGMVDPIQVIVSGDRYLIVGGEHRWRACRVLGYDKIPAIVVSSESYQDDVQRRFRMVRLNMRRGKMDPVKLMDLYNKAATEHPVEALGELFGIDDEAEWNKLVKAFAKQIDTSVLPKAIQEEFEAKANKLPKAKKTPDELNKLFAKVMKKVEITKAANYMMVHNGAQRIAMFLVEPPTMALAEALMALGQAGLDIDQPLREALATILGKIGPSKTA